VTTPARRLGGYLARHRRHFLLGLLAIAATNAVTLAGPWVIKLAIDDLQAGITGGKLRLYASAVLAVSVVSGLCRFAMRRVIIGASRDIEHALRTDFYAHLQRLPAAWFHRQRTGDLMSRATSDLSAVRMLVGPAVMYAASTGMTFVIALGLLIALSPRLTLVALLPLPIVSLVVHYFGAAIHRRFERIQEQLSEVSTVVQEGLAGVRVVRAYGQETHQLARFTAANDEYLRRNRQLIALQGVYEPSMGFLMGVSALLVLWLGAREVMAGRMSVGDLVAFNAYLMMLAWPMIAFGWVTNLWQRGMASWARLLEVLDTVPAVRDADVRHPHVRPEALTGAITIRHLTFAYADGPPVLHDVSLDVPAGRTLAVVGATGSGKSTLLALLARLHDPPEGTMFLDGHDVRHLPLATVRGALGVVGQEPFLFSTTIAENVAFGLPPALGGAEDPGRLARVKAAAAVARLDADVERFPQGYATMVGERGITLSGGQKQRTAIARAVAVDPRILVLDDALSAVDTETEEQILRGLQEVRRGRTTLIVSHRISTVRAADAIVVLDAGRVIEQGTHDVLVARGGPYAAMYRRQRLEAELAAS
jgi:ATP-binding cassette subfamily B multidrug efflux pump